MAAAGYGGLHAPAPLGDQSQKTAGANVWRWELAHRPRVPLPDADRDALCALADEGRIGLHMLARWERAVLERAAAPDANGYFERFQGAEQRKALRRKRRRLAEAGGLALRLFDDPVGIDAALAIFCRLEREGWKGRAGTALAQDPAGRAYVAEVLGGMAAAGNAFAAILSAGDAPLVSGTSRLVGD